jgi:hypothetical protein
MEKVYYEKSAIAAAKLEEERKKLREEREAEKLRKKKIYEDKKIEEDAKRAEEEALKPAKKEKTLKKPKVVKDAEAAPVEGEKKLMYRVKAPAAQTTAPVAEVSKEAPKVDEGVVVDTSLFAQEAVASKYQPKEKKEKPVKEI